MAATVVWCNECKTAVWAYDQMKDGQDIRGFLNMTSIPCPKCGALRHFDGWSGSIGDFDTLPDGVYDSWSLLKYILSINCEGYTWEISPNCTWFERPGMSEEGYRNLVDYIERGITGQIKTHDR